MTVLAAEGTQRCRILEHLATVPDLTGHQLALVIGAANDLTDVLRAMERRAEVISRVEWRPQKGRQVRLWRLAPPGTVPPPRPPVPPEVAERIRERDRITQRARRARMRQADPQPAALPLPGAACRAADPAPFFPEPGDLAAEAKAIAICAGCPARAACYAGAVARRERWGIWGGENFETRRRPVDTAGGCRREGRPSQP
jgi:Transcription factor WhiB